jgi:hypothetical protein
MGRAFGLARAFVGSRGLRRVVVAAGVVALLAHLAVMWQGFHSQDGPAHLFAADALARLLGDDPGAVAAVYEPNLEPHPNWVTYPMLATWLGANPARTAEMVVVVLLVVGLAGATYWAVTATGRAAGPVALAGFPVAVGYAVHTGLYNFTASIALLLVVVGYHLRFASRLSAGRTVVLMLLLVVLYFSHPLSLVAAFLAMGVIGLTALIADGRGRWSWRFVLGRLAALVMAATPAVLLLLWFLGDPGTVRPDPGRPVGQTVVDTALFRWPIRAVGPEDAAWAVGLAATTWVVVAALLLRTVVRRRWTRWDSVLLLPLITGVAAVVVPDRLAGGTLVQPRLAIFALLMLLVWIGVANTDGALVRGAWAVVGIAGVVAMVGLLAVRVEPYRQMRAAVDEVVGVADLIEDDALIVGAVSSRAPHHSPVTPMVHIVDRVAVEAGAVNVSNLDGGSGYGPIRYTDRFDVSPALRGLPRNRTHGREVEPRQFTGILERYGAVTGRGIDYLVLVSYDLRPAERRVYENLGYRLVHHSAPTGLVWLLETPPLRANSDVELRR